ncbi:hypothetical protein [Streptomyces sp. NRRL WC-3725]|uniref:hypothetical protein n=1 Tax=Streptomyces sp. NRRL WC-3725 TaxID=1463933 RepID=UPI000AFCCA61|nr:hypothetical protein [Streptomyces sp. NRRL WC-3725]
MAGVGGTRERWGAARGRVREVACDESGSDGENLLGGNTDVFAHASVALPVDVAAECVREIRHRIRSPAEEYKANHLLREKHRAVLVWLLAAGGPIHGRAHVHLTEKAFLVVDRAVGLLLGDPADAVSLYRQGPEVFEADAWREFLVAANALLRVRPGGQRDTGVDAAPAAGDAPCAAREGSPLAGEAPDAAGEASSRAGEAPDAPEDAFFATVDALVRAAPGSEAAGILRRLAAHRHRAEAYRTRMRAAPALFPVLNPLFPALRYTAAHWSADGRPVVLVHDRQNALTPGRIARIVQSARRDGIELHGLRLVDSRDDARVQIADFLAGIGRRIASDELAGTGDRELTACLRPYVAAGSVWGDARSWARLAPAGENPGRAAEINSGV